MSERNCQIWDACQNKNLKWKRKNHKSIYLSSWTQWRVRTQTDKNWHKVILFYSGAEEYKQQSLIYILPRPFHRSHRCSDCSLCMIHWVISKDSSEAQKYQLHFINMKLKYIRDKNCHPIINVYSQKEKWTQSLTSQISVIQLCPYHVAVLPPYASRRQVTGWTNSIVYIASLWC